MPAVPIVPVLVLPLPAFAPVQLPLAVQEVGLLVADQFMVALFPVPILVGDTDSVTTGGEAKGAPELTDTDVEALPLPPALTHVKAYV